jgi:site-specific recombinase XerD
MPEKHERQKPVPKDLSDANIKALADAAASPETAPEVRDEAMRNIAEQFLPAEGPDEVE